LPQLIEQFCVDQMNLAQIGRIRLLGDPRAMLNYLTMVSVTHYTKSSNQLYFCPQNLGESMCFVSGYCQDLPLATSHASADPVPAQSSSTIASNSLKSRWDSSFTDGRRGQSGRSNRRRSAPCKRFSRIMA